MNYNLLSEKLEHPLAKKLLEKLIPVFDKLEIKFFIIGATARDIMMELHGEASGRRTHDIDIAIAVDRWSLFENIKKEILELPNFKKDPKNEQKFFYMEDFQLDIVPYGGIADADHKIFWPPDQSFAMSVLGFAEVENDLVKVRIDDELDIEVVSLVGVFILKLVAWKERHLEKGNKDADDMGFILLNYLQIHDERAAMEHYDDVYGMEGMSISKAGAALLGIDINALLADHKSSKDKLREIIETEIGLDEVSVLFNQIIETNYIKFDEVVECFQILVQKLR